MNDDTMNDDTISKPPPSFHRLSSPRSSLLLGVDPGLVRTGWGVIRTEGSRLSFVDGGVITPHTGLPFAGRLRALHDGLLAVCERHAPHSAAIEETFVNMNSASSLKLAQARGAILLSLALAGLSAEEYAANKIKKSLVGTGHAGKEQVAHMVQVLLPGCRALKADAMDALAVAITHAHHGKVAGC